MAKIDLSPEQREFLRDFKQQGKRGLRQINRANILLLLDKGKKSTEIADFLDVGRNTVGRTKRNFLRDGIDAALEEESRPGQPKKYGRRQEAELIALACSDAPEGRERWTLQLLEKAAREKEGMATVNRESIRLMLKKTNVSLG
jgi:transposase